MLTEKMVIEKALHRYADRVLMKFVDREITYGEFDRLSTRFANALYDLGLKPGDRIISLMLNKPEGIITTLAIIKSGLVGVMVNPLPGEERHRVHNPGQRSESRCSRLLVP
ncbi:MAG: AMP-binding protein [Candidatus Freyarchaeota archaeon]